MTAMSAHAPAPRHAAFNLFMIGTIAFLTVIDLFATQAILPSLAAHFRVSPAQIGAAVNACTFGMAAGGVLAALIGPHVDKRRAIALCLALLALPTALLAFAPDLSTFSLLRIVQGMLMSSAFAMTLAHLGERCDASASPAAFAAYVSGNVASNLFGRLMAAGAVAGIGLSGTFWLFAALNLAGAVLALYTLSRAPARGPASPASWSVLVAPLRNPELRRAYAIGFCILFAFVGVFTYVNFVLVRDPFSLSMGAIGLAYLVFAPSIVTTPLAGAAALRFGTRQAMMTGFAIACAGAALLLSQGLLGVLAGMTLVAIGTFFAQAIATGFVSRTAGGSRSSASALYLMFYFLGGLTGSAVVGAVFETFGWTGSVTAIATALLAALALSASLKTSGTSD